jgi:MoxR-like ATPase
LFLVMATQNPIEQEGTYPLPEAQLDRFLMHVEVGYPAASAEREILNLVRGELAGSGSDSPESSPPMKLSQGAIWPTWTACRRELTELSCLATIWKIRWKMERA